jgi:GH24 family phage-related lysozyme (muramidase)
MPAKPLLRLHDGFERQSPDLRDEVKQLQQVLKNVGLPIGSVDGLFGQGTENIVKTFQRDHELKDDGIVGSGTWWALDHAEEQEDQDDDTDISDASSVLTGFRGNPAWVHAREGHNGKPYWPGGASGVTFDPGMDLGHAKVSLIEELYKPLLTSEQMEAVQKVLGIKGDDAKKALAESPVVKGIRISRSQADGVFPYAAKPYWDGIVKNFPTLANDDTLGSVQTAMLSLSYNRGANNKGLRVLREPIEEKNWSKVADLIGSMQQDHRLKGIRKRRRMEADYIRKELASS